MYAQVSFEMAGSGEWVTVKVSSREKLIELRPRIKAAWTEGKIVRSYEKILPQPKRQPQPEPEPQPEPAPQDDHNWGLTSEPCGCMRGCGECFSDEPPMPIEICPGCDAEVLFCTCFAN